MNRDDPGRARTVLDAHVAIFSTLLPGAELVISHNYADAGVNAFHVEAVILRAAAHILAEKNLGNLARFVTAAARAVDLDARALNTITGGDHL